MKLPVDQTIHSLLNNKLKALEKHFKADVISYFGPIIDGNETFFLQVIEQLNKAKPKNNSLYIILTTQRRQCYCGRKICKYCKEPL